MDATQRHPLARSTTLRRATKLFHPLPSSFSRRRRRRHHSPPIFFRSWLPLRGKPSKLPSLSLFFLPQQPPFPTTTLSRSSRSRAASLSSSRSRGSPFRFATSRRTKRKQGEGVAVSSVGRGPREGCAIKREEPSNGTISDERSLRVETRGRFPAGGSFFGETEGQGVPGVRHRVVSAFARFFFLLLCN